ncbi:MULTISPECIES: hypothetical protein [Cupriavidus]|uniref:Uncharacterized protein n=1 Tax=Cupriavidus pinatubonensis (strain JMP 134 / LMG 1197) TaxID=264198 RepID=Q471V6_CUPPJ|nr:MULTISPECIES: hypothetical protein [Cupriavidus]QYY33022.1 hypothetical protein K2O51_20020 [Cupriavidus pinatubonensis]TPQ26759.1 hypothetical protein C2U69_34670 [Cupriavidus pinatubonensis]
MKAVAALAIAALAPMAAYAAGPANPADRYDYNMRSTNKDGYVPDAQRATNKDGYVPDSQRAGDKFDPYTQGAKQGTASSLADDKSTQPKSSGKSHNSHKKAPAKKDAE